jgi:NAD+ synthase/NAD+ synthase (glutamine-hydrolysing)
MPHPFRVAVVQHNPVVGDTQGNADRLEAGIERVSGADLVVTPELGVLGYPPRDLLHREGVLKAQRESIDRLAALSEDGPALVIGAALESSSATGPPLQNGACVFVDGEPVGRYAKRLLPTYDVFDEHRYFEPGTEPVTVEVDGATVGISICEDAWHDEVVTGKRRHGADPIGDLADRGADLVVTLSASPFSVGKPARRVDRFAGHAQRVDLPVVFANQVGGNDDLIFDGNSLAVGANGSVLAALPAFEEATATVEPFAPEQPRETDPESALERDRAREARRAISLGIADYFRKTGFSEAIVGLSGGIDSSVAAAIAVDALGAENVYGLSLPSAVTSEQSIADARELAENLGIEFDVAPIGAATEELERSIEGATETRIDGIAAENTQARLRGDALMAVANARDGLVLTPDNKSEAAVGYCTLYGDTVGALAPLGDCYKTLVYEMAEQVNAEPPVESGPVIPPRVIEKPPTAELSEGQTDADDLPPYDQLDPVLEAYIHGEATAEGLREEFPDAVVDEALARLTRAEFKRWQTPPPLRVTDKAFGRGWKYPIAASYDGVRRE